jgi:hypothetical protein
MASKPDNAIAAVFWLRPTRSGPILRRPLPISRFATTVLAIQDSGIGSLSYASRCFWCAFYFFARPCP